MKHGIIDKDGVLIKHGIIDENAISIMCLIGVLFIGFCILFSGRYQSIGLIDSMRFNGTTEHIAKIDTLTGEIIITKVECTRESIYRSYSCKKSLVPMESI